MVSEDKNKKKTLQLIVVKGTKIIILDLFSVNSNRNTRIFHCPTTYIKHFFVSLTHSTNIFMFISKWAFNYLINLVS